MKKLNNNRGAILLSTLLLLVIITVIGLIIVNVATVEIQISGNTKRVSTAFEGADAGIDLSIPIIENTLLNSALTPTNITVGGVTYNLVTGPTGTATNLGNEILTNQAAAEITAFNTDISITDIGQGVKVEVDIDRLYTYTIEGGAREFAMGYEGIGAGAAGGGSGILYRMNSRGTK